jgi:hypothetical protein
MLEEERRAVGAEVDESGAAVCNQLAVGVLDIQIPHVELPDAALGIEGYLSRLRRAECQGSSLPAPS